jgi:hypothetical protein
MCSPKLRSLIVLLAGGTLAGAVLFAVTGRGQHAAAAEGKVGDPALGDRIERLEQKATDQAHVMVSVAYHFNNLWFAAQHDNWPLAGFYLNETRSHLRWAVRVIPVRKGGAGQDIDLRPILESLENTALQQLDLSIKSGDHGKFVHAYKFMLEGCRGCHGTSEKPFLRVRIPTQPADPMVEFDPPVEQDPGPGSREPAKEK